jgi:hypothetical protein
MLCGSLVALSKFFGREYAAFREPGSGSVLAILGGGGYNRANRGQTARIRAAWQFGLKL